MQLRADTGRLSCASCVKNVRELFLEYVSLVLFVCLPVEAELLAALTAGDDAYEDNDGDCRSGNHSDC